MRPRTGGARRAGALRLVLWSAAFWALFLGAGCRGFNRAATKAFFFDRRFEKLTSGTDFARRGFEFTSDDLEEADFRGPASSGKVEVFYQGGLEDYAERLASDMDAVIAAAERATAFDIRYRLRLYLFSVNMVPQRASFSIEANHESRVYSAPVFVESGSRPPEKAAVFPAHPFYMLHELAELTLVCPEGPYRLAPDLGWGPFRVVNGTRWFREGWSSTVLPLWKQTRHAGRWRWRQREPRRNQYSLTGKAMSTEGQQPLIDLAPASLQNVEVFQRTGQTRRRETDGVRTNRIRCERSNRNDHAQPAGSVERVYARDGR